MDVFEKQGTQFCPLFNGLVFWRNFEQEKPTEMIGKSRWFPVLFFSMGILPQSGET